ncbi:endonuclease/exonuclease/phosphatase family protein [Aspergillus mulundensis]|uniref:Endonuclease/exonuclease/phosphatase domain-containing protein n=1 Tax=Aspergillus mulundensis TaxID=1810919 RepID=A0A3D8R486_9EURO|nr:Uncharacterized protein DSM5745_08633 [Aspergillus mulundensis]RDW68873.1 Uncharacterized protein DSM5745_08633 [Aspergillus mulundensis]
MDYRMMARLRPDEPNFQPFFFFDPSLDPPRWRPVSPPKHNAPHPPAGVPTDKIHLLSWNIDFTTPLAEERMTAALKYLGDLQAEHEKSDGSPTVIFFQEMVASDLHLINETPWVREKFYMTDLSGGHWRSYYGTTTLIDRRLSPERVFRVPYKLSAMQRDALFVDVKVEDSVIRLCNTHLESLASGVSRRPVQLKLASTFMHGTNGSSNDNTGPSKDAISLPTPQAAILAGDLNAFAPEDAVAPGECNLEDAYLAVGGTEGAEEGFTWGYQSPSEFAPSRMDKVLFSGRIEPLAFRLMGKGLKIRVDVRNSDEEENDPADDPFEDIWVTDHFGLVADFRIEPREGN